MDDIDPPAGQVGKSREVRDALEAAPSGLVKLHGPDRLATTIQRIAGS